MTEHLSRGTVYRLFRGHLSTEDRERLLRHLMSCPLCQGRSSARAQKQPPSLATSTHEYDEPMKRAFAAALAADRAALQAPASTGNSVFFSAKKSLSSVEQLFEKSWACRYSDPLRMVELAKQALATVEELDPDEVGRALLLDFKARALAELANAHRVAGDLPLAGATMHRALRWLRSGTGDLTLRARVIDLLASLLAAQRRLPEAIRLTQYLGGLYEELGAGHMAGRALISTGVFLGMDARPEEGLCYVVEGLGRIDRRQDPGLARAAFVTVINLMTEAGLFSQARRTLWRCRLVDALPEDRLAQLHVLWIEGKIYAGLNEGERAEKALLKARRGFVRAEQAYMAAFVGLDLALLWVRRAQRGRVLVLLEEMLGTFRRLEIAREALTVLLVLRHALELPDESTERLCRCIGLAATLLTQLERQPAGHQIS